MFINMISELVLSVPMTLGSTSVKLVCKVELLHRQQISVFLAPPLLCWPLFDLLSP